jgi:septal ring factor EnvC (AmiA/AmiB activator)
MDITGIDIAAVAGLVGTTGTAIVSIVKAVQASRKAGDADRRALDIELAREKTKRERDQELQSLKTEVAVLKALQDETNKRLAEGTDQFKALDDKVDKTNSLLHEILGALNNRGFDVSRKSGNGGNF